MNAIETTYKGCVYRSATECAWALLLDLAGVEFTYEPQKIGAYWPDFQLRHNGLYLEIKARKATPEELAKAQGINDLIFLCGRPKPGWVGDRMQAMGWSAAQIVGNQTVRQYQPRPEQANDLLAALLGIESDVSLAAASFASKWSEVRRESREQLGLERLSGATIANALAGVFGKSEEWAPRTYENF